MDHIGFSGIYRMESAEIKRIRKAVVEYLEE
jgi:hypothetical protein